MEKPSFKYKKLQLAKFFYWMNERHNIYLARKAGKLHPWTKDKILRDYKFTNVFRQLDRVTQEWTQRFITLLGRGEKLQRGDLLFHCIMFRIFNWPETYDALFYNMRTYDSSPGPDDKVPTNWNLKRAIKILEQRKVEGKQIFTGAYIVTSGNRVGSKIVTICEALNEIYKKRMDIAEDIYSGGTMQNAVEVLQTLPTVGPFVGYEIACDLSHTRLLQHAKDRKAWANPGPGAKRGIHRLLTGGYGWPKGKRKPDYNKVMRDLYVRATGGEVSKDILKGEWPFEMREIEHSLCEFDKYMRVKNGEGRPRAKYKADLQMELPWGT